MRRGDEEQVTTNGATLRTVTNTYGPGSYDVALTVSNSLGMVTNSTRAACVRHSPPFSASDRLSRIAASATTKKIIANFVSIHMAICPRFSPVL